MGLLSASFGLTRYKVEGQLKTPILETVAQCLKKNTITEIDKEDSEKAVGWTSFQHPYNPNFDGSLFVIGTYFVFSLRIDKKSIPAKVVKKHCLVEEARKLKDDGRDYLSRSEKKLIKETIIAMLSQRIPATPNVYDLIWDYEEARLYFFTNQKSANEELENLFSKTFKLNLIRLFPYSMAELKADLSSADKDVFTQLTPTKFFK
jgi:DNA recombination-dependent growth factor C